MPHFYWFFEKFPVFIFIIVLNHDKEIAFCQSPKIFVRINIKRPISAGFFGCGDGMVCLWYLNKQVLPTPLDFSRRTGKSNA